jgi:Ca2+/Na+ antiporter
VGNLFLAISTSLPEVVVSLAAVRLGALDLAVGNVLGSNLFNDVWLCNGNAVCLGRLAHVRLMSLGEQTTRL